MSQLDPMWQVTEVAHRRERRLRQAHEHRLATQARSTRREAAAEARSAGRAARRVGRPAGHGALRAWLQALTVRKA